MVLHCKGIRNFLLFFVGVARPQKSLSLFSFVFFEYFGVVFFFLANTPIRLYETRAISS
jgi:hypothetical protein